jgi:hypothetical protein
MLKESTVNVDSEINIPTEYSLSQNYPNPFNPSTTIQYSIPIAGHVSLKIYDMIGREVKILVDEYKKAGVYNSQLIIHNYPPEFIFTGSSAAISLRQKSWF